MNRTAAQRRRQSIIDRISLPAVCTVAGFLLVNGASFFVRSDGYALHVVADGIRRCGFPLLFWENGGFVAHEYFHFVPFAVDGLFAAALGFVSGNYVPKAFAQNSEGR